MSDVKLFEVFGDILRQIAPEMAEVARANRRVSRVHTVIDVLWTPEEEAIADAAQADRDAAAQAMTEAAVQAADKIRAAKAAALAARTAAIESAAAKLRAFGLTDDEISAMMRS